MPVRPLYGFYDGEKIYLEVDALEAQEYGVIIRHGDNIIQTVTLTAQELQEGYSICSEESFTIEITPEGGITYIGEVIL